jgi:UDP-N-acetylmuramyl pentapeptide phosphotransferase/UDP-N-acetylglucosamine-1-phosphate transferase
MAWGWAVFVAVSVFAASYMLTGALRGWLAARAVLDRPVARSSHSVPVPRGGGLAVVSAVVIGWLALAWQQVPRGILVVLVAGVALAVVSWRDDRGGLPVPVRLGAHALAVAVGLSALPAAPVFDGVLPLVLDRVAAALLWLWFVELFNFMDGIDGLTGIETVALGVGLALVVGVAGPHDEVVGLALVASAAALGFLRWNWHPAQIFLGDVGSVPLGFLLGWLLLSAAARGLWAPALILPLYYLADATITLARRVLRRAPFWQPHREHFYQRALGRDGNHAAVAQSILLADAVLVGLALLALTYPVSALVLAATTVALLLYRLEQRARNG